jgi:chorismate synthase
MALRFLTAGESHGPELNIIVEGIPANMPLVAEDINLDLKRRQGGYGRGGRMKIEKDQVIFTAGVRHGRTFGGAPIAMRIINKDHEKWLHTMNASTVDLDDPVIAKELADKFISKVRPGHADFAGALKYNANDVRDILERSSARETTSRVAAGALCKKFLQYFNIEIFSHVLRIGTVDVVDAAWWQGLDWTDLDSEYYKRKARVEASELRIFDDKVSQDMKAHIDAIRKAGDTIGGLIEVFALGLPVGLGSHVQWDRRIDGLIAQAMMSTHTVKSVEIGLGERVSQRSGSQVQDQIYLSTNIDSAFNPKTQKQTASSFQRYARLTNNLGGIEGGMTNGLPISCRVAVKPIPTLVSKLDSIDLQTKAESESHFERSDVCVVPAAGVVLEAMLAIVLADCFLEKFGGDSMEEISDNYQAYLTRCSER